MKMIVDPGACSGCAACVSVCPSDAISMAKGVAVIDQSLCTLCQRCLDVCPTGAITAVETLDQTAETTMPASSSLEVIDAEPISVIQKPEHNSLAELGARMIPRLFDALIGFLDLQQKNKSAPKNSRSFINTSHSSGSQRRRRQRGGHSRRR
ncbi:MAG: 4Fe-4S binding protein [Anaerolineaceae bacterium]|nr:4Fe-4S binding protein [Anaerolineaceae bacterium]